VKALLDTAGEWYYNKRTDDIFYMPADDVSDPNFVYSIMPT